MYGPLTSLTTPVLAKVVIVIESKHRTQRQFYVAELSLVLLRKKQLHVDLFSSGV